MNDPNAFGYQENPATMMGQTATGGPTSMAQYNFSPDEMRVLQECNKESFFQRSVPLGMALGLGTLAAVQRGFLRPNPRFGAMPKVTLSVLAGYFLGKLSYQRACAEKLMSLPGSYIGQLLRDRRDGVAPPGRTSNAGIGGMASGMLGAAPGDIYSDAGPGSALNLDTDRPTYSDDSYRADNAAPVGAPEAVVRPPELSYEELRRRNRGEHADAKQDPYRVEGATRGRAPPPPLPPPRPPPRAPTNQYGDALD